MVKKQTFASLLRFIILLHWKNWLTYQCPSSWPVVITINEEEISRHLKKSTGYWPVQINGDKFTTGQILKKQVEVVKGRILAGWAQKSLEPCLQQPTRAPPEPLRQACAISIFPSDIFIFLYFYSTCQFEVYEASRVSSDAVFIQAADGGCWAL